MTYSKEDRRIRRTKKLLKQALAELMEQKDFNDITVKDITEKADLNRGTFYLHYSGTYDLLEKIENEILGSIQQVIEEYLNHDDAKNDSAITAIYPIGVYIMENADICRCLINNKASSDFIDKFQELIFKNLLNITSIKHPKAANKSNEYYFSFIAYGVIGVLKCWLSKKPMPPVDEVAKLVDKFIISVSNGTLK